MVSGVNSFTLSAQKKNPNATVNLVLIDSWYDPPKEAAATETMINLGDDIITTHTDSPGPLQILEQKGLFGFGQGADMSQFAPNAHLTAIEDIWGPYYTARAQAVLDGTWKSTDTWDGFKEGTVVISPYNKSVPADVAAAADEIQAGLQGRHVQHLHRPDLRSVRRAEGQGRRSDRRRRPRGDGLVRQGRRNRVVRAGINVGGGRESASLCCDPICEVGWFTFSPLREKVPAQGG